MRLFDLIYNQLQEYPLQDAFAHKIKGEWRQYSTSASIKIINQLSQGLIELGVESGDKISIISEGRPEWCFVDLACQQVGAVLVPLYPTLSEKDYNIILKEAEVKMIFVSNSNTLKSVHPAASKLGIETIFTFNRINGVTSWLKVLEAGKGKNKEELQKRIGNVGAEDTCTIIYTSGTSGQPKGVMLSHHNIVSNVLESSKVSSLDKGKDRALSFLPMNHIFEKTGIYIYVHNAIGVYFAESMDTIADNLREVRPHTFNTVPRLLEKVYDKIIKTGSELAGVKKNIFNWAISLGLNFDPKKSQGTFYDRQLALANRLVFSKWRDALGGNIKQIQCGASALQPRLARVFWSAGIKVLEGYGLTETSPVVSANRLDDFHFGSVGKVYENLEVKLGDEDEILVKGPSVMQGYYKNEKLTKEVLEEEGWFKTGDVGKIQGGFLFITDRKKELFKTSGGMYIAPQQVENKLKESVFVEQAMVIGEGERFPAVLIVPNTEELLAVASKRFLMIEDSEELRNDTFSIIFKGEIDKLNDELGSWAQIKEFRIVQDEWSPETGELTPTLKLKRRVIKEKYKDLIEEIYGQTSDNLFEEFENIKFTEDELKELEKLETL